MNQRNRSVEDGYVTRGNIVTALWHSDWFEYESKHIIVFDDDTSRFITGFGVFNNATAESTVETLDQTIQWYGAPTQIIADYGAWNETFHITTS